MHTFMDAKLMAKLLRQALAERGIDVSHAECLEFVARQFGLANWNILSAKIEANAQPDSVPRHWTRTGRSLEKYRTGVDQAQSAAWIQSQPQTDQQTTESDFCTLMQSFDAASHRGKRLRLSAELKSVDVAGSLTIWLRVDGPAGSIRFENLESFSQDGPISSNTDWVGREIVLEVPEEALSVHYGFYLKGRGKGLARAMVLEEVPSTTPLSAGKERGLDGPTNLRFDL